jgi:hypothetical protein
MTTTTEDDALFYTTRPGGTALWLPQSLMRLLDLSKGAELTADQFSAPPVQLLIEQRSAKKKTKKQTDHEEAA